jgi:hypothetical protein
LLYRAGEPFVAHRGMSPRPRPGCSASRKPNASLASRLRRGRRRQLTYPGSPLERLPEPGRQAEGQRLHGAGQLAGDTSDTRQERRQFLFHDCPHDLQVYPEYSWVSLSLIAAIPFHPCHMTRAARPYPEEVVSPPPRTSPTSSGVLSTKRCSDRMLDDVSLCLGKRKPFDVLVEGLNARVEPPAGATSNAFLRNSWSHSNSRRRISIVLTRLHGSASDPIAAGTRIGLEQRRAERQAAPSASVNSRRPDAGVGSAG